jgi:hypothetical protein
MIGPVSILSLAAVSAAETTSSGRRGLREPVSMMWPAIILGGTAFVCLGAGYLTAFLIHRGGSSGDGYKVPENFASAGVLMTATGCKKGSFQSVKLKDTDPVAVPCTPCVQGTTNKGPTDFAKKAPDVGTPEKKLAVCSMCAYGWWPKKDQKTCIQCNADETSMEEKSISSGSTDTIAADFCATKCVKDTTESKCICVKQTDDSVRAKCGEHSEGSSDKCDFEKGTCTAA